MGVLRFRQAEQQHAAHAGLRGALGLRRRQVGRQVRDAGERRDGLAAALAGHHEHRQDQVRRLEARLAHQIAQSLGPPQSAGPDGRGHATIVPTAGTLRAVRGKLEGLGAFAVYQVIALLVLGRVRRRSPRQRGRARTAATRASSRGASPGGRTRSRDLRDPLLTDRIYAPEGFNLAWATVIPGPAVLAAPLTLLTSPIVSYNVLALMALPLNGLGAFLLCREVTGKALPALVGGGVFAFSCYGLAESVNHLNLALVVCVPLAALVGVRHARGRVSDRRRRAGAGAAWWWRS